MKKLTLVVILVWSVVLRAYNNTAVGLWHDEAFSAQYIKYGWGEMMHRIILDVHPPLYYFVLRFWSYAFGHSLLSLRSLSILLGALTVWAGYLFVKKAFKSEKLALWAAFFLAINPFQVQYALEARMYTLGTFLVLFSSWLLLRALESKNKKDWIFYGIAASACFYTHYYLLFSIAAQGLYALYIIFKNGSWRESFKNNPLVNLTLAGLTAFVLYIPWLPGFLEQFTRVQGGYWIPPMDRWSIPGTIWKIAMGGQGINRPTLLLSTIISLLLVWYFIKKYKEPEKWLVVLGLVIPFLAAIVLSLKSNIYLDRYFVFASLSFSILIALALNAIPKLGYRRLLISAFIIISLFAFWKNWKDLDVKDFGSSIIKKPGMSAAGEYLNERVLDNDRIYVGSSFIFFTFKYYNQTPATPKLISGSELKDIPHYAGTAILKEDDLVLEKNIFNQSNYKTNDIIWLLWTTGFGGSKPNVPGNWVSIGQQSWADAPGFKGDIYVTQYRVQ
jgi:mannosyltransferase